MTMTYGAPLATATDLVEVRDLTVSVATPRGRFNVIQSVNLSIAAGEMLGLVGESGSGKSVTGAAMCRLLPPVMRQESGSIVIDGEDVATLSEREMVSRRGSLVAVIPQDPMTSLDPAFTVGHQIMDVLLSHGRSRSEARARALECMRLVRIADPERRFDQYPHQMSGGMRQRALIAMAISCEPRLLIADEPTTALDATTQAQVLEVLRSLCRDLKMATLFTTHDLGVARDMCTNVAVMYAGQIVEAGALDDVFASPQHPYAEKLLASIPSPTRGLLSGGIPGQVPGLTSLPTGCRFHPRCVHSVPGRCNTAEIPLTSEGGREVRCVRRDELELKGVYE